MKPAQLRSAGSHQLSQQKNQSDNSQVYGHYNKSFPVSNIIPIANCCLREASNSFFFFFFFRITYYTWLKGPQTMGDKPMNKRYKAFTRFTMAPVVLYSVATSGVAARTDVLDTGERKALKDIRIRIITVGDVGLR